MEKEVMKELYELKNAVGILGKTDGLNELGELMNNMDITIEEINEVNSFINETVSKEYYSKNVKTQAMLSYMKAFLNVKKIIQQKNGYEEMGDINLNISNEMKHLEDESEVSSNGMD